MRSVSICSYVTSLNNGDIIFWENQVTLILFIVTGKQDVMVKSERQVTLGSVNFKYDFVHPNKRKGTSCIFHYTFVLSHAGWFLDGNEVQTQNRAYWKLTLFC